MNIYIICYVTDRASIFSKIEIRPFIYILKTHRTYLYLPPPLLLIMLDFFFSAKIVNGMTTLTES